MFFETVFKGVKDCRKNGAFFVLILAILATTLQAAQYPLADKVPAEAFWYQGYDGSMVQRDDQYIGCLFNMLNMGHLGEVYFDAAQAHTKNASEAEFVGKLANLLEMALGHPATFYFYGWDESVPGHPKGFSALLVDTQDDTEVFTNNFNAAIAALQKNEQVNFIDRQGNKYAVIYNENCQHDFIMGFVGNLFVITNEAEHLDTIAEVSRNPQKSLSHSPRFNKYMAHVNTSKDVFVTAFIDIQRFGAVSMQVLANNGAKVDMIRQIMPYLGCDKIQSFVLVSAVEDGRLVTKAKMISPAPHTGLMKLLVSSTAPTSIVSDLPADCNFLTMANIDLAAMLDELRSQFAVVNPRSIMQVEKSLQMASGYLGMSIEDKVLSNIGPRVIVLNSPSAGGYIGPVIMIDLKDAEAFKLFVKRIESFASGLAKSIQMQKGKLPFRILTQQVGDAELSSLQFTIDKPVPVNPTWTVYDNKLILSPWPAVVKSIIAEEVEVDLGTSQSFKQVRGILPDNLQALAYADSKDLYRQIYFAFGVMSSLLLNMQGAEAGQLSPLIMPTLGEMEKTPLNGVVGVWAEDDGIVLKCSGIGNIVAPVYTVAATAAVPAIMLPALSKAKAVARVAATKAGLRAIYQGAELYRMDNRLLSPDNLDQLAKFLDVEDKLFVSPRSKKQYVYLKLPANSNYELIQAYDAKPFNGKVLVVQAGGMVSEMEMEKFKELLAETQKFLKSFNEKYKNVQ